MSLWAEYVKERLKQDAIETEDGFITYEVKGRDCFLVDFFVRKDRRGSGAARYIFKRLCEEAKAKDCVMVSAHIWPGIPGAERVLEMALKEGFRLFRVEGFSAVGVVKDLEV